MQSIGGVGTSGTARSSSIDGDFIRLPHPDRFAVFPAHEGEGGQPIVTTTLPRACRLARWAMASPPRARGKCSETCGRILPAL